MLRSIFMPLAVTALSVSAASAMQPDDLDLNGDRFVTLGEIRQVLSGFSSNDFRDIDHNNDRRLSNNELISSEGVQVISRYQDRMMIVHGLTEVDQDGDRFVSKEELRAVYNGVTQEDFRRIDINRDNRISAPELYAPLAQALVTRYEMGVGMLVTIMQVDTNDDYFVGFDELRQSFPGLTYNEFEIIDVNGDNRVSSVEYYKSEAQALLKQNQS